MACRLIGEVNNHSKFSEYPCTAGTCVLVSVKKLSCAQVTKLDTGSDLNDLYNPYPNTIVAATLMIEPKDEIMFHP